MMWDQILLRLVAVLTTDDELLGLFGDNMRYPGTGALKIPALEWSLIGDAESEVWAPCTIQFDIWHEDMGSVIRAEARLRALFHGQYPFVLQGLQIFGQYLDGDVLASPNRDGFNGRAIRFRFTSVRGKYARSSIPLLSP